MSAETLSLDDLRALSMRCLTVNGCNEPNAAAITRAVIVAEGDDCASHGVIRLPGYVRSFRSGFANGDADPTVSQQAPAVLRVEGDNGFAPLALERGYDKLAELARENGIAALGVANTHHFAAVWPEIEAMTDRRMCALACTASLPVVPPPGGKKPVFGTNPVAFGWPRDGPHPVIFDQASATMAHGAVLVAAREGRELPEGVGLDSDGNPSTDPEAVANGAILPFGGYKGGLLAMMVELLSCALIGEEFGCEASKPRGPPGSAYPGGELLIAIDPDHFGDRNGWIAHAEVLFAAMTAEESVRLPAARRYAARARAHAEGVSISESLLAEIRELANVA